MFTKSVTICAAEVSINKMLKGAYLLAGQSPETGAHSLMEHVYQLSSLCWSQQWEGKLTCNLETIADKASTPAATKRTEIQALASKLGSIYSKSLAQKKKKTEWKVLPHGHRHRSFYNMPFNWFLWGILYVHCMSCAQCHICWLPVSRFWGFYFIQAESCKS